MTSNLNFMKRILSLLVLLTTLLSFDPPPTYASFNDVGADHRYFEAINALEKMGVLEGYADGSYKPEQQINRAEALKIILLGSNINVPNDVISSPFPDVSVDTWYAPIVSQAKLEGIVSGDDDTGLFRPGDTINLAEILKVLLEANQRNVLMPDNGPYADVPVDAWYAGYFEYAKKLKLLDQSSHESVFPNQQVTRGMMADLMYQLTVKPEGYEEGVASYYGLAVQGNGTASGEIFNAYDLTAAHPNLPFGTEVRVINLENGKEVIVRINDRGPYGEGRVIDLSRAAFEEISSLSTGLVRVAVLPLNEGPQMANQTKPCSERENMSPIAKESFEDLTLDVDLPNRFFADEVWPVGGTSWSDLGMVTAFVMNESGRQYPFYANTSEDGRFELELIFPGPGTYQVGMLPGSSGETTVEEIVVLESNCLNSSIDLNQFAVTDLNVELNRGELEIKWQSEVNYDAYKLHFTQDGREKVYLVYDDDFFVPHYADFEGWNEGMVHLELQGADLDGASLLQSNQILWGPAIKKDFMALTHHPYSLKEDQMVIDSLPERLRLEQLMTITIDPIVNVNADGLIVTPTGSVETIPLESPTHNPIVNKNGVKIIPHTAQEVSLNYTASEDAVYFMEINNEEGIAVINVPIYPEGTYPLIPNPVDVAGLSQTELNLSPQLIQLQLLSMVNEDRMSTGLNNLRLDEKLSQLAQVKAEDMADQNYFSHWTPEGEAVNDMRKEFAITSIVSENIARDASPQLAHFGLMSSAAHRLNILDPEWDRAGFGFVKDPHNGGYLFVQIFSEDPVDVNDVEELRGKVFEKLNSLRNNPLNPEGGLNTVAQAWSQKMTDLNFFDVNAPGNESLVNNVHDAGYDQALGSLLLADTRFEDLLEGLTLNAPLLNENWASMGVGIAQDSEGLIKMTLVYVE